MTSRAKRPLDIPGGGEWDDIDRGFWRLDRCLADLVLAASRTTRFGRRIRSLAAEGRRIRSALAAAYARQAANGLICSMRFEDQVEWNERFVALDVALLFVEIAFTESIGKPMWVRPIDVRTLS